MNNLKAASLTQKTKLLISRYHLNLKSSQDKK